MDKRRFLIALVAAAAAAIMPATAAASTDSTSENWAGYMITAKHDKQFSGVTGEWTQPTVTCDASGESEYSAYWLGLGGGDEDADALEQIGTEADCSASGRVSYYAWYELVPSAPVKIDMAIHAGDALYARTRVTGDQVSFMLVDQTTGGRFIKKLTMTSTAPDTETAEWVTEAPSECDSSLTDCAPLPLADFGTANFRDAHATANGYSGTITSGHFKRTAITLKSSSSTNLGGGPGGNFGGGPGGSFGGGGPSGNFGGGSPSNDASDELSSTSADATPSALSGKGTAFSVTYSSTSTTSTTTTSTTTTTAESDDPTAAQALR